MTPERWQQVAELCDSALSLEAARRAAFLEEACAGDALLRQELEALLACDEYSPHFLETPALEAAAAALIGQETEAGQPLPAGSQIGPYRIVALLGAGGMGQVYQARDTRLERDVALKFLPAASAHEAEALKRLQREARAASALSHPNICTLHDIDEHEGQPFLVMELLEGQSLKQRLAAGPLPVGEVLDLAVQISDALRAAHSKGVVHRDIKPGNLFLTSSGHAKILDFGLSKLLSAPQPLPEADPASAGPTPAAEETISRAGAVMGTVAYMSPEQAEGRPVDTSSDVFSLGAVLYEMLTGRRAFQGESNLATLSAILRDRPAPLRQLRADVPEALERIVNRCLEKNREARYSSAAALWKDLTGLQSRLARRAGFRSILWRPRFAIPAVVLLAAVAVGIGWLSVQNARIRWARAVALPEIARLTNEYRNFAALLLIQEAERYLPGDPELERSRDRFTGRLSVRTDPPGADFYLRDYLDVAEGAKWVYLGRTPLNSVVVPAGVTPYRIVKPGFETLEGTASMQPGWTRSLLPEVVTLAAEGTNPPGMTRVPAQQANAGNLVLMAPTRDLSLEPFWLDQHEVTNRQFKEFVDRGGYENRDYWRQPFVKEGRGIPWEEAMAGFRDVTGRPGPATWEFGTYPKGQADYPVSGVSWYEAAAYAEFAGKSLPTVHHWRSAAGLGFYAGILQVSNFSGKGLARVGSHRGLSPYGNYDMAGNVREWCWNPAGRERYILGGAWSDLSCAFYLADVSAPMDRSPTNGFRCAKYSAPLPEELTGEVRLLIRDRRGDKPAGDEVFQVYRAIHQYDRSDLKPALEAADDSHPDWRVEKVSFQAAYGNERMNGYLYLPKNATPPYQTVVFFPGAHCLDIRARPAWETNQFGFLIRSGRALMFPTYRGTYERTLGGSFTAYRRQASLWREMAIQWAKDLGRSLDYLETRPDIERDKLAYYGSSMGAAEGPRLMALEPRLKTGLLLWGGCWESGSPAEVDPYHFAPRVRAPILMVNGRDDFYFPLETSQVPLFRLLGTPEKDKRHLVVDGGHALWNQEVFRETVAWLDRYLGPVRTR